MPKNPEITFEKLPIKPEGERKPVFFVYVPVKNGRSIFDKQIKKLSIDDQDKFITLISKMALYGPVFKSDHILYKLKNYTFGELRPFSRRFFFFRKCGKNYIVFDYREKKQNKGFDDKIYKNIERKKKKYENAFEEWFKKRR